jgi:glycosyltransferase involved in cell wall biosynthesis
MAEIIRLSMKIEVFAICYNEEVMLPFFLRHYLSFCDRITIYDNCSTDGTDDILQRYNRNRVSVVKWDSNNQVRDDLYLKIKNNCWKHSIADWVIICDVDELVYGWTDPGENTIISPDWCEMVSERIPNGPKQIYEYINEGVPQGQVTKCIMFKPERINEINYHPGCHGINAVGDVQVLHTPAMKILHYKFLSMNYVKERHRLFGQRMSDINKKNRWGVQYEFNDDQKRMQWEDLWNRRVKVI